MGNVLLLVMVVACGIWMYSVVARIFHWNTTPNCRIEDFLPASRSISGGGLVFRSWPPALFYCRGDGISLLHGDFFIRMALVCLTPVFCILLFRKFAICIQDFCFGRKVRSFRNYKLIYGWKVSYIHCNSVTEVLRIEGNSSRRQISLLHLFCHFT